MSGSLEIQLIAVLISVACTLPGTFLVLRKMSMMSDSLTHTLLLGIVLAFFITHDLSSPLLIVGAALVGLLTVWLTETLHRTRLLAGDASIGIVFPLLFSIAVILITRFAGSAHIDTDMVLLGELAFAPFNRLVIGGVDIGAKGIYVSGILLVINLIVIIVFFKEFKLITFDPALAMALGFSPALMHYGLMSLVSLTTVGAFDSVGSLLVVAFMIGPPVTAYLLTDDLKIMLLLGAGIGTLNAILGYHAAVLLNVSISGCMAVMTGITFGIVFLFAPKRGLISSLRRRKKQRFEFAKAMMLFHLVNHSGEANESIEANVDNIHNHLKWSKEYAVVIAQALIREGSVRIENNTYKATTDGFANAEKENAALFS